MPKAGCYVYVALVLDGRIATGGVRLRVVGKKVQNNCQTTAPNRVPPKEKNKYSRISDEQGGANAAVIAKYL